MNRMVGIVLAALLALPAAALAQAEYSQVILLTPTKYGATLSAQGKASLEITQKGVEVVTVGVSAELPSRSSLNLQVTTWKGTFSVGGIRMLLGMGTFEQWSTIDPSPVFPVAELTGVVVYEGKDAILQGTFEKVE